IRRQRQICIRDSIHKEIRRRQEEAARRLPPPAEPDMRPVEVASVETAPQQIVIPSAVLARMPNAIIRKVAAQHGVTFEDILGDDRAVHIVAARYEAIRAVREVHPTHSIKRLGRIFGGRDHSSIRNALGMNQRARSPNKQRSGLLNEDAPSPAEIIETTARKHSVSVRDVIGRSIHETATRARYEAAASIRSAHPDLTSKQIGALFDGRSDNLIWQSRNYMRRSA
ncbi:helix-turn-helix domain-containing protein, partial [Methylorubrum zatmanii]|uniref:helix-turn-helix domain-containing protein n=1 Tax=Methylorubrum zatmanii TaxID=29429 RepID=UPI001AEE5996